MKTSNIILLVFLSVLFFGFTSFVVAFRNSLVPMEDWEKYENNEGPGAQPKVQKTFNPSTFTSLQVDIPVQLVFDTTSEQSGYSITAPAALLDEVIAKVENNTLIINKKDGVLNDGDDGKWITITVHQMAFESIENKRGLYSVSCADTLVSPIIDLRLFGNELSNLLVHTDQLKLDLSGNVNLISAGKAQSLDLKMNGSGSMEAPQLLVEKVDLITSGSGAVNIHAINSLKGSINGSGYLTYHGNPQELELNTSGSSSIKKEK